MCVVSLRLGCVSGTRGCGQDPLGARRRHQHALQRVQGVGADAGVLQGPPGHGALPAGGGRRPRAQDGRDAHGAHGGQHGRTRRGRATTARLRRTGHYTTLYLPTYHTATCDSHLHYSIHAVFVLG